MPGMDKLDPIPFHEMFVRLCYKFDDTQRDPELDGGVEGGSTDDINDSYLDTLGEYLHFADVIYEAGTEGRLLDIIAEKGVVWDLTLVETCRGMPEELSALLMYPSVQLSPGEFCCPLA